MEEVEAKFVRNGWRSGFKTFFSIIRVLAINHKSIFQEYIFFDDNIYVCVWMHVPWHRPCCKSDLPLVGPGDQVSIWVKHFYKGGRCGRVSLVKQMEPCMHVHAPCHFPSTITWLSTRTHPQLSFFKFCSSFILLLFPMKNLKTPQLLLRLSFLYTDFMGRLLADVQPDDTLTR